MNPIDKKINELFDLTNNFIFVEYYSHTNDFMYKIMNEYTDYNQDKLVLSPISEGIEKALDLAIDSISKAKEKYI